MLSGVRGVSLGRAIIHLINSAVTEASAWVNYLEYLWVAEWIFLVPVRAGQGSDSNLAQLRLESVESVACGHQETPGDTRGHQGTPGAPDTRGNNFF